MPDSLDISFDPHPDPALIEVLGRLPIAGERAPSVADLREWVGEARTALARERSYFDDLFRAMSRSDAGPEQLVQVGDRILEKRRVTAARVCPGIERLQQAIAAHDLLLDSEVLADLHEGLEISHAMLEILDSFRRKALDLAAQRGGDGDKILRARPVEGEIDHAALSGEFMARFPKIRAALAK